MIIFILQLTILFSAISFCSDLHWDTITSLINPTDVQFSTNGNISATTNGGVIHFNLNSQSFTEIGFDEGLWPLDLEAILLEDDNLFVADQRGGLQIYNVDYGSLDKITHLDFIEGRFDCGQEENKVLLGYFVMQTNKIESGKIQIFINDQLTKKFDSKKLRFTGKDFSSTFFGDVLVVSFSSFTVPVFWFSITLISL